MICSRPHPNCTECGDTLIHQFNRGPHESSSAFGQFVHDRIGIEMYWADVDGTIYKKRTKALRVIEHKRSDEKLSNGQREILPLLAKGLQLLAATGLIHEQSGVYIVRSDHPHAAAGSSKSLGGNPGKCGRSWSSPASPGSTFCVESSSSFRQLRRALMPHDRGERR
jgi:hypothetical protein